MYAKQPSKITFWIQEQDRSTSTLRKRSQIRGENRALARLKALTEENPYNHYAMFPLGNCTTPFAVGYQKSVEIRDKTQ